MLQVVNENGTLQLVDRDGEVVARGQLMAMINDELPDPSVELTIPLVFVGSATEAEAEAVEPEAGDPERLDDE